jgi:alkanesulfonate monooxygenase SsuD/methylene tetrahydromethanopterin reductase-like flavin-dependent oxidoreductase (luciferase family)
VQFAVDIPAFHDFSDLDLLIQLAVSAEQSGWDRFALWDHLNFPIGAPVPTADAWLAATAIIAATERIQVATHVTPLPRRLPHEVARQATTLHHFSGGRFVLGVGSGGGGEFDEAEFGAFGGPTDARERGERLDEALDVILGLWSGEVVAHSGPHYRATGVRFVPASPHRPGTVAIPIWVGGFWGYPRPLRRAARYDGYAPVRMNGVAWSPEEIAVARRQLTAAQAEQGGPAHPVQVMFSGRSDEGNGAFLAELADAGLDWWSEGMAPWERSVAEVFRRVEQGPTVS